uniref:Uncharacterized protein n=1 Tax=viral metagenome TaxID=1070528 RepID=A0A6C0H612_9ZZZZ
MSETKKTILKLFHEQFYDFILDMQKIFPEEKTINVLKNSFTLLKNMNPVLIIKVWNEKVVSKYKNEILSGNIEYFLEKDYSDDLNAVDEYKNMANGSLDKNNINNFIENLKPKIKIMSNENKQKTIKYLQNLVELSIFYENNI